MIKIIIILFAVIAIPSHSYAKSGFYWTVNVDITRNDVPIDFHYFVLKSDGTIFEGGRSYKNTVTFGPKRLSCKLKLVEVYSTDISGPIPSGSLRHSRRVPSGNYKIHVMCKIGGIEIAHQSVPCGKTKCLNSKNISSIHIKRGKFNSWINIYFRPEE